LIYYAALRWGETLLASVQSTMPAGESTVRQSLSFVAPIAVGLLFFATVSGAAAYLGVKLLWRLRTTRRWRERALGHRLVSSGLKAERLGWTGAGRSVEGVARCNGWII
jgi:uncharacterized protein (DUF2062 family)